MHGWGYQKLQEKIEAICSKLWTLCMDTDVRTADPKICVFCSDMRSEEGSNRVGMDWKSVGRSTAS
jgi:hypothetical protein